MHVCRAREPVSSEAIHAVRQLRETTGAIFSPPVRISMLWLPPWPHAPHVPRHHVADRMHRAPFSPMLPLEPEEVVQIQAGRWMSSSLTTR